MARELAPCGTWAAYKRHLRKNEEVDEACRQAARDQKRNQREQQAADAASATEVAAQSAGEVQVVSHMVAYGKTAEIEVPVFATELEGAEWLLARTRAALIAASPKDVAPLSKAVQEAAAEVSRLSASQKPKEVSALDQLAQRRAQRLAAAQG